MRLTGTEKQRDDALEALVLQQEIAEELERERERKRQKTEQGPRSLFGAQVVVDLGFDEKMTENVSLLCYRLLEMMRVRAY